MPKSTIEDDDEKETRDEKRARRRQPCERRRETRRELDDRVLNRDRRAAFAALPPSRIHERTGMLSNQPERDPQPGHVDGGVTSDCPRGRR